MDVLACPRCSQQLSSSSAAFECTACKITYPLLDQIAWLWPEPDAALLDWRNRFHRLISEIDEESTRLDQPADATAQTSDDRIALYRQALSGYPDKLTTLLAPLNIPEPIAPEVHLALKTALPEHHAVDSYMPNVFRDWCWGEAENALVAGHLRETLAPIDTAACENVVVLGSGAGRLALDIHLMVGATQTIALDANPLLCAIANQIYQGKQIELPEFVRTPIDELVIEQQLTSEHAATRGIQVVCADAFRAPIQPGTIDLLVTPWLIDVVDTPLDEQITHYANLVKPGGYWLNHGSLFFNRKSVAERYNDQAVQARTTAGGFDLISASHQQLPYLCNPRDRQQRHELTYTQLSRRTTQTVEHVKYQKHEPAWLTDPDVKIPLYDEFRTQITTTRVHGFIMSLINGERSIREMAQVLEDQRLMPATEAAAAIGHLLRVMYNERLAQQRER